MALFKYPILPTYNMLYYDNDYLILHCSRFDEIFAPFDGEIVEGDNDYILCNDNISLHINHINNVTLGVVKIGDKIGNPIVDAKYGNKIATIGIKIYDKDKLSDILVYLKQLDKTVTKSKKKKNKDEETDDKKKK